MRFVFICLSVIWVIYGETLEEEVMSSPKESKVLQVIAERLDVMEENVKSLVDGVSKINNVLRNMNTLVDTVSKIGNVFDCGKPPSLSNGHFKGNSTYTNDVMFAVCNDGYMVHGNYKITCTADRTWSRLPTCQLGCKSPQVSNSRQYNEDKTYKRGSSIFVECNRGYVNRATHSYDIICLENGEWSDLWAVSCRPVECKDPPVIYNGTYNEVDFSTTYNTKLTVTCDDSFEAVGAESTYCSENGEWVGKQLCMQRVCVLMNDSRECYLKVYNRQAGFFAEKNQVSATDDVSCITECFSEYGDVLLVERHNNLCYCLQLYRVQHFFYTPGFESIIKESEVDMMLYLYRDF